MKFLNPNHESLTIQPYTCFTHSFMETNSTVAFLHSKTLLTKLSAITRSYACIFQASVCNDCGSTYFAHALLSNSFFIVFLVQGIKEEIYTKLKKDISITEEVP